MLCLIVSLLAVATPCLSQTFTLDPVRNCPGLGDAFQIPLFAGTYHIEYVSGAWSPVGSDDIYAHHTWSSRVWVNVYANATMGVIGSPDNPGLYETPELAEAAARGVYVLVVPLNSLVAFWLNEVVNPFTDCNDNRGSVTLRFVNPLATEPTTWSAVKALYR
jgi:hypothetical protein